jgi:hypothetical protein
MYGNYRTFEPRVITVGWEVREFLITTARACNQSSEPLLREGRVRVSVV